MPLRVTFIASDGTARTVAGEPHMSVMAVAKANDIPEIEADCGGVCSCASCHVHVEPGWEERFPLPSRNENALLSLLPSRNAHSRLSCQLKLTDAMDGLTVRTPAPEE